MNINNDEKIIEQLKAFVARGHAAQMAIDVLLGGEIIKRNRGPKPGKRNAKKTVSVSAQLQKDVKGGAKKKGKRKYTKRAAYWKGK